MKKSLKYILLIIFVFWVQMMESKTAFQHGLVFNSYEIEKENRTGLNLTPEGPFSFPEGFILEFDVSFRKVLHNFGYVFRIVGKNDEHVDLLLTRTRNSEVLEPQLTAIYKSGQVLCTQTFEDLNVDFDQWIRVKLIINPRKEWLKLIINEKEFEKTEEYFGKLKNININFGKNDILFYETSDVPSMAVKDVKIKSPDEKIIYHWELARHVDDGVYDEIKGHFALCESPNWILDTHAYWQKIDAFTTGIYPQFTFNRKNNRIAVIDQHTVYFYDVPERSLKKDKTVRGFPLSNKSNQLSYNLLDNSYFTYNFTDEVAFYDTVTKIWNNENPNAENPHYWYHNRFFSSVDTALYTWGGYGFHIYKNDIHKYHFRTKTWEQNEYKGDVIAPRYLAGLGAWDDKTVLLFGGYGSEKGDQELSPHNYYDLYSFDLETATTKKKWELNEKQHNFVVANSLVIDTFNNCFYALCFPHQKFNTMLRLYRFSIEEPSYEIIADSIPYLFSDIYSYADLFLSEDGKQLIALTSYTEEKEDLATVNIYTLSYPPLNEADLFQAVPKARNVWWYALISLCVLILLVGFIWKYGFRKKSAAEKESRENEQRGTTEQIEGYVPIVGIKPLYEKNHKQSISLFGGFQVIDRDFNNITGEFTPTLKQLFLLILLYTLKDGKGISSVKLREILWFDKTNESAKNNRGVSLSKLRAIFEKIGEISINSKNSYWLIEFGKEIYCDYYEALILMDRLTGEADPKDINRLISIVSEGELLPNLQTEWVDPFKSDFSNRLIDLFLNLVNRQDLELTPSARVNIADAIFAHDSLNEDALKIKCSLLVKMGKNGLAQKIYNSFIKEYQSLFGVDFKYTFEQIIS